MNTGPLTSTPIEQSSKLSKKTLLENERSWRELILRREMESIWNRLAGLAQSHSEWDTGDKTQDLFLRLLNEQRFNIYVDESWSDEEITRDLLSLTQ